MAEEIPDEKTQSLVGSLQETLAGLIENPYPHVPNPESCRKRASVALILRVRPNYQHWPESCIARDDKADVTETDFLGQFFAQSWVQHGDPEAVFIKRAARVGDRWTSHVALPGGKRDPEDEDDKAVAIRETSEEIGLDLTSPHAFFIGNLPERVVATSWGKVPLMVLCPFVFLWTQPDMPPLKLQPTEIASTHWVPLRVLLAPSSRTYEYVDVSDRFVRSGGAIVKTAMKSVLGKMRFSAIQLVPSESLYCSSTAEFFPSAESASSITRRVYDWYMGDHAGSSEQTSPLLLWGLTLGVLADFLDQLPPHNAVKLWSHPTFTSPDVRWIINLLTGPLKRRNQERMHKGGFSNQTAMDSETQAVATGDNHRLMGDLADGTTLSNRGTNATKSYAVGVMLEGYYDMARRGVWIAATLRLVGTIALFVQVVRRYNLRLPNR